MTTVKTILRLCAALGVVVLAHVPLASAHWPDQPPHQMAKLGELKLERGGVIPDLKISYVTHGKLNAAKDNAILFLHGFGGEPSPDRPPHRPRQGARHRQVLHHLPGSTRRHANRL